MTERELSALFDQAVEKGAIEAIFHFDAHGKEKAPVEALMIDLIARAARERGILHCTGEIERAIENNELYSCSAEVKLLAANYDALINLSLKFGPIAVEIVRPSKVTLDLEEAQSCLLDAAQASHDFSKFVFERVLVGEEKEKYNAQLAARAELGKQLMEKNGNAPAEKKE